MSEPTPSNSVSHPTRSQRHQVGSNLRGSPRFDKLRSNLPLTYRRMGNTRPQGVRNLRIRSSVARARRPRSRVTVAPRSFLDAGTAVLPGDRKFLDYAFPPLHTPTDVV